MGRRQRRRGRAWTSQWLTLWRNGGFPWAIHPYPGMYAPPACVRAGRPGRVASAAGGGGSAGHGAGGRSGAARTVEQQWPRRTFCAPLSATIRPSAPPLLASVVYRATVHHEKVGDGRAALLLNMICGGAENTASRFKERAEHLDALCSAGVCLAVSTRLGRVVARQVRERVWAS